VKWCRDVYPVVGDARMAKSEWSCGYQIRVYGGERQTATGRGLRRGEDCDGERTATGRGLVDNGKGTRVVAEDGGRRVL
jgi:hypothetical protein